jgi:lysozyme family protein
VDFNKVFDSLIGSEGSFSKDPKDPGNWTGGKVGSGKLLGTKYGIAANTYPKLDIPNLTLEDAKAVYLRDFWNQLKLDTLPNTIRYDLFDTAVNSGIDRSVKLLQRSVGADEDGIIGPNTLKAIQQVDPIALKLRFNAYRLDFMTNLKVWPTYSKGWAKRIVKNMLITIDEK